MADQQFDAARAAEELNQYRTNGPGATTRMLLERIAEAGVTGGTVLDIGSGIGALSFALVERGFTRAMAVDASFAYTAAAREEAARLGRGDAVEFIHADFVTAESDLRSATLVTLDRVVCCYPSYEPLLAAALRHADRCIALTYPRDVWFVRLGVLLENAQRRLSGNSFRMVVHPATKMQQLVIEAGFELCGRQQTWTWSADVYTRR